MKKNFYILLALSALSFSSIAATNDKFLGASVGANINLINSEAEEEYLGGLNHPTVDDTEIKASVDATYTFAIKDNISLGLGASYTFGHINSGNYEGDDPYLAKNLFTAYIEPGYSINPETLIYGKLGYATMQGVDDGDEGFRVHGVVYGLGAKHMINDNFFLKAEINQIRTNHESEIPGDTDKVGFIMTQGTIGAGYTFR